MTIHSGVHAAGANAVGFDLQADVPTQMPFRSVFPVDDGYWSDVPAADIVVAPAFGCGLHGSFFRRGVRSDPCLPALELGGRILPCSRITAFIAVSRTWG